MKYETQVEIIKNFLSCAIKPEVVVKKKDPFLNKLLMVFIMDEDYTSSAICKAEKEWRKEREDGN